MRQIPGIKFFHGRSVTAELVNGCARWRERKLSEGFG